MLNRLRRLLWYLRRNCPEGCPFIRSYLPSRWACMRWAATGWDRSVSEAFAARFIRRIVVARG